MASFADPIGDERAGHRPGRAIRGMGAFRRFKAELHDQDPHHLPAWHALRYARAQHRAVRWLADNSLIDDDVAARFLDEHPEPEVPEADTVPPQTTISAHAVDVVIDAPDVGDATRS